MLVKVLVNNKGEYLKDYALEAFFDFFPSRTSVGLMGQWTTTDPREAMHFWTSMDAIVARNWNKSFNYKNVEI